MDFGCFFYNGKNSPRIIENIEFETETNYKKKFTQGDSVFVFNIPNNAYILRMEYPLKEETDFLICE